jgi:hypothetical protein
MAVKYDTVTSSGASTEFEIVAYNKLYNVSPFTETFRWVAVKKTLPSNWDWALCDLECHFGVDSFDITLASGDSVELDVHFYPGNTAGNGSIGLLVYPTSGTYSDGIKVFSQVKAISSAPATITKVDFSFYPNPVHENLEIRFSHKGNHTIEVYNILGTRLIRKEISNADRMRVSFENLQNGMYVIMYKNENGKVITKTISKD